MKLRVRFAETDQMGIAHHSAYVVWLEAARVEWLRDRGVSYRELEDEGVSLAVSQVSIDYRRSLCFDDEVTIDTTLSVAKSRRFRYDYRLTRGDDLIALASTLHTPMDRTGRAIRFPQKWFDRLVDDMPS
ncbi:MAG: thioesterase family protein [Trueperaceae bacterium]|nr:thioesterase family protein [Trueperaceae bacterium]